MANPTPDTTVATAMNRVLEAESAAAGAIATAQQEADLALEAAREARRRMLERTRQRASRIHSRAEARLAAAMAALEREWPAAAAPGDATDSLATRAVAELARLLTSADHEST